ncbi:MAG: FHA domain-containing protein, partial [Halobacteriales archaeon]|nr:FHA domain-containing protein [Halobacteriales archaeon]
MSHFWLEVETDGHRQRFDFDQQTVSVGRDQASDFHLDHPTVSRRHALFVESGGEYQLVVLSKNGLTAVDGSRVSGTVDLRPGQTLQFGEIQLAFRTDQSTHPFGEAATEMVSLDDVDPKGATAARSAVDENTEPSRQSLDRTAPQGLALGEASDVRTDSMQAVGGPTPFGQQPQQASAQQGFSQQGGGPQQGFGAQQGGGGQQGGGAQQAFGGQQNAGQQQG